MDGRMTWTRCPAREVGNIFTPSSTQENNNDLQQVKFGSLMYSRLTCRENHGSQGEGCHAIQMLKNIINAASCCVFTDKGCQVEPEELPTSILHLTKRGNVAIASSQHYN